MKYLPAFIILSLLIFCGSLASSAFRQSLREQKLHDQYSRTLENSGIGVNSKHYDHYFVPLAGTIPPGGDKAILIEHIKNQIWGAKTVPIRATQTPKVPESEFSASVIKDGEIVLHGRVHSHWLKSHLESAAREAIGTLRVKSNLIVNQELNAPHWDEPGPDLLKKFLSFSGAREIVINSDGVRLEGEVLSQEVREKLGEQASQIIMVPAVLNNNLSVKRTINPTFQMYGSEDGFKIAGLLPDEETRKSLVALIRSALPEKTFKDEIKIAGGVAKPWWLPNAETLIPMFLKETGGMGTLEYWKNYLRITGTVGSESFEDALASLSFGPDKPADFSLDSELTIRPQIEPQINIFTNDKGKIVLQGELGSSDYKNEILVGLMAGRPDLMILDQINVSDKVKDHHWGPPARLIEELIFNTRGGTLKLSGNEVMMAGQTASEAHTTLLAGYAAEVAGSRAKIENLTTFPEPVVEVTVATVPVEAPVLEPLAPSKADFTPLAVYFDTGESRIESRYKDEIEKSAGLIKTLNPDTKIVIGGYSDNKGSTSTNQKLSIKRATAVMNRLVAQGVDQSRMEVQFYTDSTNTSRKNRWKSRRVEISIKPGTPNPVPPTPPTPAT